MKEIRYERERAENITKKRKRRKMRRRKLNTKEGNKRRINDEITWCRLS
jgi:CRISPR/Cas system CSM-associated protein Csm5 (group 7 of RAMP superfamily)